MRKKQWLRAALFITMIMTICLTAIVFLSSCSVVRVLEISVSGSDAAQYIGEFDFSAYEVVVKYESGETETVKLDESMISAADKMKLFNEGEHEITVGYLNRTAVLKVIVRRKAFDGVVFADVETVYTGEDVFVTVQNVPEGTTVTYPNGNRFRNAGVYQAKAILKKDAFDLLELTAEVKINKADYDLGGIAFDDKIVTYSGEAHGISVEGDLPEGLNVEYTVEKEGYRAEKGNSATNAGDYTITAYFTGDSANYNAVSPRTATLTVVPAAADVSAVRFEDKTVKYDQDFHGIYFEGDLPSFVDYSYGDNAFIDAGEYTVVLHLFTSDSVNYAPIPDMTAKLTIEKADYDMSDVRFNDLVAEYDGTQKEAVIRGNLPGKVDVRYENNAQTEAGTYVAKAVFETSDPNYNAPEEMTANIVIKKALAKMDEAVFPRVRFLLYGTPDSDTFWDKPNDYRPSNVSKGIEVDNVVYYPTDGYESDFDAYDGVNGEFTETVQGEGYYVVVVTFKANDNYTDITPVKTQIRVSVLESYGISMRVYYDEDNGVYMERRSDESGNRYYEVIEKSDGTPVTEIGDLFTLDTDNISLDDQSFYSLMVQSELPTRQSAEIRSLDGRYLSVDLCDCAIPALYTNAMGEASIRGDGAEQMSDGNVEAFDELSAKYEAFISGYNIDNEPNAWKLQPNKPRYPAYGSFFSAASALYENCGQDLFKDVSLNPSKSILLGLNRPFYFTFDDVSPYESDPSVQQLFADERSGYEQSVALAFGYKNFADFKNNFDDLVQVLAANAAGANASSLSARLKYKGAVYTENGSFVLPYLFVSDASDPVAICIIVDKDGAAAVWIGDATELFKAVNVLNEPSDEVPVLTVYGRDILFDDGGYVMMSSFPKNVDNLIRTLLILGRIRVENGKITYIADDDTEDFVAAMPIKRLTTGATGNFVVYINPKDTEGFLIDNSNMFATSTTVGDSGDLSSDWYLVLVVKPYEPGE